MSSFVRFAVLAGSLLVLHAGLTPAAAQTILNISALDGYGLEDCFTGGTGSDCGHVVADALCESNGHAKALSFGPNPDITGSIPVSADAPVSRAPGAYTVTCGP